MSASFPFELDPVFRAMAVSDVGAVMAIEKVSFPTPWSAGTYRHEITRNEHGAYWVVSPRGAVVRTAPSVLAYAGTWQLGDEVHVTTIAVHPNWRRRMLGEWTLLNLIAAVRRNGARLVTLEVRTSNAPAIALYRKLGFEEVGLRRGYYLDTGEDAYLMTLFHIDDEMVWQKLAAEIAAIERQSRPPSDGDSPAGR